MADTQVHPIGTVSAPADYTLPPSSSLLPKAVFATFDGTSASGSFYPVLEILSDADTVVVELPADTSIAAGASADVSWFPRVGAAAAAASSGATLSVAVGSAFTTQTVPDLASYGIKWGAVTVSDAAFSWSLAQPANLYFAAGGVYAAFWQVEPLDEWPITPNFLEFKAYGAGSVDLFEMGTDALLAHPQIDLYSASPSLNHMWASAVIVTPSAGHLTLNVDSSAGASWRFLEAEFVVYRLGPAMTMPGF